MNARADELGCRYCGDDLTHQVYNGEHWHTDPDGATVCPAASVTNYLGHSPAGALRTRPHLPTPRS